jgi:hypothetical protein
MLRVTCKPHLLSVIILSAVMLSVVAPSIPSLKIFICSVLFANFKKLKTMLFYKNNGPHFNLTLGVLVSISLISNSNQ